MNRAVRLVIIPAIVLSLLAVAVRPAVAADYVFGSENVIEGYSSGSANRDAEDATYQTLTEEDQYANTNFSGSSENVVTGTAGGGAFPGSLDSDDATRRSYTEEDTGGAPPAGSMAYLYPTSDVSVNWDDVYPSGDHYAQVDETTVGGDGGTTYLQTGTTSDIDIFGMADLGDPGAGYTLDVYVFAVHYKGASQPCNFEVGLRIDSTNYQGYSVNPSNGDYTNESSAVWTTNPDTSAEWTYADLDAIQAYITTSDASPDVRCTQVGIAVYVNFSASTNYELDAQITYSSVTSTAQTTGYMVYCQAYRTDASEDFGIFVWDYVAADWSTIKDTIDQTSDTDFNFALTTDERDGTGNEVKIRILGLTETSDSTQNVVYFDILKVSRIEEGYALQVEMTASSVAEYGELQLRIKGYTSSETFYVYVWNYSESMYDEDKITITAGENTWHSYYLYEATQRSGTTVKIQFVDGTAETGDTTADTLYLDVVWVTSYDTDPVLTGYQRLPGDPCYPTTELTFNVTYWDADNEAPTDIKWREDGGATQNLSMTETDAGDTTYYDGKVYAISLYLDHGEHFYDFYAANANGKVSGGSNSITIGNRDPVITTTGNTTQLNDTFMSYHAQADEYDGDDITWEMSSNATFLTLYNDGWVNGTATPVGYYWIKLWANDSYGGSDLEEWQLTVYLEGEEPEEPPAGGDFVLQVSLGLIMLLVIMVALLTYVGFLCLR